MAKIPKFFLSYNSPLYSTGDHCNSTQTFRCYRILPDLNFSRSFPAFMNCPQLNISTSSPLSKLTSVHYKKPNDERVQNKKSFENWFYFLEIKMVWSIVEELGHVLISCYLGRVSIHRQLKYTKRKFKIPHHQNLIHIQNV